MAFEASIDLGTIGFSITDGTITIYACAETGCTSCSIILLSEPVSNFPLTLTNIPDSTVSLYLSVDSGVCIGTNQCVEVSYPPFVSVWTAASPIELPYSPTGTYTGTIDWGDGSVSANTYENRIHNYETSGDYTITITGQIEGWDFMSYATAYRNSIKEIKSWGSLRGENNSNAYMFNQCENLVFTGLTGFPNFYGITSFEGMFYFCTSITYIPNLESWDVSSVTNMGSMFANCLSFNQEIGNWNVSGVTNMNIMFAGALTFNSDISSWNVSNVIRTDGMFVGASSFDKPLNTWNVSGVTDMSNMFLGASSFNQPLDNWDVSNVSNMEGMFNSATSFNQSLNSWNVSSVTNMIQVFAGAIVFNGDVSTWNVSNVTSMRNMFAQAGQFNSNISSWNVSGVTDMRQMLYQATSFNQDLGSWNVSNVQLMEEMLDYCGMSQQNYDNLLIGWASQTLQSSVSFGVNGLLYSDIPCLAHYARNHIANTYGWFFYGDGAGVCTPTPFVSKWLIPSSSYTIYLPYDPSGAYNGIIDWGDGTIVSNEYGNRSYTYASPGTYTVIISGRTEGWNFNNDATSKDDIIEVVSWGPLRGLSNSNISMFYGCSNLTLTGVTDTPNLFDITSTNSMFRDCTSITTINNINSWDVSSVTDMFRMFTQSTSFNENLGDWNVSNVTDMTNMLTNTAISQTNYDNLLIGWSNLTLQNGVTFGVDGLVYSDSPCPAFQAHKVIETNYSWAFVGDSVGPCGISFVSKWNITGGTETIYLPYLPTGTYSGTIDWGDGNTSANTLSSSSHTYSSPGVYTITIEGQIEGWNFNNVDFSRNKIIEITKWGNLRGSANSNDSMFQNCTNLVLSAVTDTPILTGITSTNRMFKGCTSLTTVNNMDSWSVSGVTSMSQMFYGCTSFDQNIGSWDVSNVTDMSEMFYNCQFFNQYIGSWDVRKVNNMSGMFFNNGLFDQNIGSWIVSGVTNMSGMLKKATTFNQDISNWNVSNVTNMSEMLSQCAFFNQNLGNWNVSGVTNMNDFAVGVPFSRTNYESLLIGWSGQNLQNGVIFGASAEYSESPCLAGVARDHIITNYGWTITGDSEIICYEVNPFVFKWFTPGGVTNLPTDASGTYSGTIDWGDGNTSTNQYPHTHTYASSGIYTISITGQTDGFSFFGYPTLRLNLREIISWGGVRGTILGQLSNGAMLNGCQNLTLTGVTDTPYLKGISSLNSMFFNCTGLNIVNNMDNWNVSGITDMTGLFNLCSNFNTYIGSWNTSNVTNMQQMFQSASVFNQPLSGWNTSKVTNMSGMFNAAYAFNKPLNNWNVSGVTNMNSMFYIASSFNQNLSTWCVSQIPSLPSLFDTAAGAWTGGTATRPQWGAPC